MLGHLRKAFSRARTTAEKGASAVEYGLMVAAIAAVIVGTVFALGGFVKASFDKTCSAISQPTLASCVTPYPSSPPLGGGIGQGPPPPPPGPAGRAPRPAPPRRRR